MSTPKTLTLKLLIDNKSRKVLFAEGGKEVVDFLFGLLAIPVGTIIKLLRENKQGMVGCIENVYESVETLDEIYMQSTKEKNVLLNPTTALSCKNTLSLTDQPTSPTPKKCYQCCYNCIGYYSDTQSARCPDCRNPMSTEITFVEPDSQTSHAAAAAPEGGGSSSGFVKGVVTYMVMDDLSVTPMSTISSITLLNRLNVIDLTFLEERRVNLGLKEGLKLLKASLMSKTALTDVFVEKKTETVLR